MRRVLYFIETRSEGQLEAVKGCDFSEERAPATKQKFPAKGRDFFLEVLGQHSGGFASPVTPTKRSRGPRYARGRF